MTDNEIINCLNDTDGKEHIGIYCTDKNGNYTTTVKLIDIFDLIKRQKAEIERLQKYNTDVAFKHYNDGIKEFAERLKKKALIESGFEVLQSGAIDDLVKEMTITPGRECKE